MEKQIALLFIVVALVAALPHQPIIRKLDTGLRYQYAYGADGQLHLVDLWGTISDVAEAARYNPDTQNVYHLFTRRNPSVSQVLVPGNEALVWSSNFNATQRTAIIIHGWLGGATDNFNAVMTPEVFWTDESTLTRSGMSACGTHKPCVTGAIQISVHFGNQLINTAFPLMCRQEEANIFTEIKNKALKFLDLPNCPITEYLDGLSVVAYTRVWFQLDGASPHSVLLTREPLSFLAAEDMNVIVVDWCSGACTINYLAAVRNTVTSGEGVARFITWLNSVTGADPTKYHVTGFSLGGQQSGVVGRNLGGVADYITSLDPAGPGWDNNENKFTATDGNYTEVIHTNVGQAGFVEPLGQVDFYPNGGVGMPGCSTGGCDHERAYFYLAESLRTGGFTGRKCENLQAALASNCTLPETLAMGGVSPKPGAQGVYYLPTNGGPPFSQG